MKRIVQRFFLTFIFMNSTCGKAPPPPQNPCESIQSFLGEGTTTCSIYEGGKKVVITTCIKILEDGDSTDKCNAFCVQTDGTWKKFLEIKKDSHTENAFTALVLLNPTGNAIAGLLNCIVKK